MKHFYIIGVLIAASILIISAAAFHKETTIVNDCVIDGTPQTVIIESTTKPQSEEWSYFTGSWAYLGQEMRANGYVTIDTFVGSCQHIP